MTLCFIIEESLLRPRRAIIKITTDMCCSIDWDKCLLSSDSTNPQVDFVADYRIDGKILLLPVRGSGKSNITMCKYHTTRSLEDVNQRVMFTCR